MQKVNFNLRAIVAKLTKTTESEWTEIKGPRTGNGLDYWYERTNGDSAWININQESVAIRCYDVAGDYLENSHLNFNIDDDGLWAKNFVTTET